MRWTRFVDDDFWKMLARFLVVLLLVITAISLIDRISTGSEASVTLDCIKGEC